VTILSLDMAETVGGWLTVDGGADDDDEDPPPPQDDKMKIAETPAPKNKPFFENNLRIA